MTPKEIKTKYLGSVKIFVECGDIWACGSCGSEFHDKDIIHIIDREDEEGYTCVHDNCKKNAEGMRSEFRCDYDEEDETCSEEDDN